MIKFRLYSDRKLTDLLSLLVPEKSEIEETDNGVIIKLIYNGLDYNIRNLVIKDNKMEVMRYRNVYPKDPEFINKLIFISKLVDKYENMNYSDVINDLTNKINDKV